jgi:hypothetical protein
MGKIVGAGAGAELLDKLEPKPHKNGPVPQHSLLVMPGKFSALFKSKIKQKISWVVIRMTLLYLKRKT